MVESLATAEEVAVFVDTNCFIQVIDLKDLPWHELFPAAERIDIVVSPTVVDELDEKKNDRNPRVRDRARLALSIIRTAAKNENMQVTLKEGGGRTVTLRLGNAGRISWDRYPKLDPARPDDRFVADALETTSNGPKVLLSHDTGPVIRARLCGLEAADVPETWLLPDSVDDTAKEIARLKRDNEALRNQRPALKIGWEVGGAPVAEHTIERLILPPLPEDAIRRLVENCMVVRPRHQGIFSPRLGFSIGGEAGLEQADFERYNREYEKFAAKLPEFFAGLHKSIEAASQTTAIDFRIANNGNALAEGLTVDFRLSGEWLVFADEEDAASWFGTRVTAPEAPLTPRLKKVGEVDALARDIFRPNLPPRPRDPTGFYWEHRPARLDHSGSLRCEEFRATCVHEQTVWVYPWGDAGEAVLDLEVHARNMSAPVPNQVKLTRVERSVAWTDPRVGALVEDWIGAVLASCFSEPAIGPDFGVENP